MLNAKISPKAAQAIELVADKWVIEVLHALRSGQNRYGMLQRHIPEISKKMLTQTLRKLERSGIIERIDYQEVPLRVEYFTTPAGDALIQQLTQMCQWSKQYFEDVVEAREQYDTTNKGWV